MATETPKRRGQTQADAQGQTKKRVRPLTEARKTQNRLAQRAYRERQKTRQQQLSTSNGIDASQSAANGHVPQPQNNDASCSVETPSQDALDLSWLPDLDALENFHYTGLEGSSVFDGPHAAQLGSDGIRDTDRSSTSGMQGSAPDFGGMLPQSSDSGMHPAGTAPSETTPQSPGVARVTDPFAELQRSTSNWSHMDPRSGYGDGFTGTGVPICTYSSEATISLVSPKPAARRLNARSAASSASRQVSPRPAQARRSSNHVEWSKPRWNFDYQSLNILGAICQALAIEDVEENYDLLRYAVLHQKISMNEILSAGLKSVLGGQPDTTAPLLRQTLKLPDPRANTLRFVKASTLTSYLFNARALGLDVKILVRDWSLSAFHRPIEPWEDPKVLQESFNNRQPPIPPHLRPTLPQIIYSHHPYIDLIPFPTLRARAIALAATTPPMYDMLELKHDIMTEGLVCWRTPNGSPHGQPWDMRNWEVAPWFLKKWRMLLGGEDGEIWAQSRWWQRMRGEEVGAAQERAEGDDGTEATDEQTKEQMARATVEGYLTSRRPEMPVDVEQGLASIT